MKTIESRRSIDAPLQTVFAVISNVERFADAVPQVKQVEFLTNQTSGVGTRYRETRQSNGKTQSIELEITQQIENDRIRMISDAGGAVWDTLFTVAEVNTLSRTNTATELTMVMEVRPHHVIAGLFNRLIRSMIVKGVEADMDAVKVYCESSSQ